MWTGWDTFVNSNFIATFNQQLNLGKPFYFTFFSFNIFLGTIMETFQELISSTLLQCWSLWNSFGIKCFNYFKFTFLMVTLIFPDDILLLFELSICYDMIIFDFWIIEQSNTTRSITLCRSSSILLLRLAYLMFTNFQLLFVFKHCFSCQC